MMKPSILARLGRVPRGERLARIQRSPNYRDGGFVNLEPTPVFTGEDSMLSFIFKQFRRPPKHRIPPDPIPHVETDLRALNINDDVLVWFGHSSYFMQIDGKRVLVDPVLSGHASPFNFMIKAFKGSNWYTVDKMPDIDILVITHDHWDHLDHGTMLAIKDRVSRVVCPLGVASHLEYWGFAPDIITELDWHDHAEVLEGFTFHAAPARHFSGRGLTRHKTLWASFAMYTPTRRIYIGGDSGYGSHFADIGAEHGPFDLALIELGQYNENWKHIHMMPEFFMQAVCDLQARRVMPVHNSKFALAQHAWDDPLSSITRLNEHVRLPLVTPRIGEVVHLDDASQSFSAWWCES